MQQTLTMSRKTVAAMLILLIIAGAAVIGLKFLPATRPTTTEAGPAQVAVEFTRTFYAVDYRDQQAWLKALQPLATSEGYALLKSNIAGLLWPTLAQAQVITTPDQVHVEDKGLVLDGTSKIGGASQWQVRSLAIALDGRPWPVMKNPNFSTDIMLRYEQGSWKFSLFLTDDQVQGIKQQNTPSR